MGAEHLDQAFILRPVLVDALELVAAGAESTARRVAKAGNIGIGFLAGVDQVLGQGTENAVAAGEELTDLSGC